MNDKPLFPTATLLEAVQAIEFTDKRAAVIVNNENKLLGTITDGDIRRKLLTGGTLQDLAISAMNSSPITAQVGTSSETLIHMMKKRNVLIIPTVTSANNFVELIHLKDLNNSAIKSVYQDSSYDFAVIMAGGEGVRLKPVTNNTPKPMLEVGGVPLLERQILSLSQIGIKNIYISVNYLSDKIEEYFEDGSRHNVKISYLKESSKMGTAGSISLIPENPKSPFLVLNGDIFTNSNFGALLEFHNNNKADITVATTNYVIDIPYGVIDIKNEEVIGILEKPSQVYLCNAGIYCISPEIFNFFSDFKIQNMPDLITLILKKGLKVSAFPIHEYWIDIGTPEDLKKAREFYNSKYFLL